MIGDGGALVLLRGSLCQLAKRSQLTSNDLVEAGKLFALRRGCASVSGRRRGLIRRQSVNSPSRSRNDMSAKGWRCRYRVYRDPLFGRTLMRL